MLTSSRNVWAVEDNWITLRGSLGDFVDDVIVNARDLDMKVRLAAVLALASRAKTETTDKRALSVMLERLSDTEAAIRTVAASAFGVPGWVDATVEPCFRNRLIAQLRANAAVDPSKVTRAKADAAAKLLLELGLLDSKFLPIAEKCMIDIPPFVPDGPPDLGPLVDPTATPAAPMTTGQKVAIVGAAAVTMGVIGYAILGRRHPAPKRNAVKRR